MCWTSFVDTHCTHRLAAMYVPILIFVALTLLTHNDENLGWSCSIVGRQIIMETLSIVGRESHAYISMHCLDEPDQHIEQGQYQATDVVKANRRPAPFLCTLVHFWLGHLRFMPHASSREQFCRANNVAIQRQSTAGGGVLILTLGVAALRRQQVICHAAYATASYA